MRLITWSRQGFLLVVESLAMRILQNPSSGQDVLIAQCALFDAGVYTRNIDGSFGPKMQAAVQAFQSNKGLPQTGIIDATTATALGLADPAPVAPLINSISPSDVSSVFPGTPLANIDANLPYILNALHAAGIADRDMILMALATIAAETSIFLPISEEISTLNTSATGLPFDLYDHRTDLGNNGAPDGSAFRGRGFIQLTGRANFQQHGNRIGLGNQLIEKPTLAHQPEIAAKLLASFLQLHEPQIRAAIATNNFLAARKLVNGGSNGYQVFEAAYTKGMGLPAIQQVGALAV
jgi:peptidoglycan L-alanyl-D-glutamate endopeptidase CwlK